MTGWSRLEFAPLCDDRSEKVNLKIRDAQLQKVPYMLVIGGREAEEGACLGAASESSRTWVPGRRCLDCGHTADLID